MTDRSNKIDVRNPLLALPSAQAIVNLPPEAKVAMKAMLMDLLRDAAARAQKSWKQNKGPMAAYWKAVSVYAGHTARLCRTP